MTDDRKKTINVLERAFDIIERLAENPDGRRVLQLAEDTGLPPSTTHRILNALLKMGYISQEQASGVYRLTGKLLDVGSRAVLGRDLRREALPYLRSLREATGESAHLVVLDGSSALTVEALLSEERNIIDSRVGQREPLHCTGVGKCLIAYRPDVDEFIARLEMQRFTDRTICTVSGLRDELDRVRAQGYALDWDENEIGVRCIAAPVMDSTGRVIASVGVSGPSVRVTDATRDALVQHVLEASYGISRAAGWPG